MSSFAETLKTMRAEVGWSQWKLAQAVPCDRSAISRWEREGRIPTRQMCISIAAALELNPNDTARLLESAGFVVDDLPSIVRGEWALVRLARLLADPELDPLYAEMARNLIEAGVTLLEQNAELWRQIREESAAA